MNDRCHYGNGTRVRAFSQLAESACRRQRRGDHQRPSVRHYLRCITHGRAEFNTDLNFSSFAEIKNQNCRADENSGFKLM